MATAWPITCCGPRRRCSVWSPRTSRSRGWVPNCRRRPAGAGGDRHCPRRSTVGSVAAGRATTLPTSTASGSPRSRPTPLAGHFAPTSSCATAGGPAARTGSPGHARLRADRLDPATRLPHPRRPPVGTQRLPHRLLSVPARPARRDRLHLPAQDPPLHPAAPARTATPPRPDRDLTGTPLSPDNRRLSAGTGAPATPGELSHPSAHLSPADQPRTLLRGDYNRCVLIHPFPP